MNELAQIDASTLCALEGETDDLAMATIIGLAALRWKSVDLSPGEGVSVMIEGTDPLEGLRF